MALWVCTVCTTKYRVALFLCPRCHNTEFHEEGDPMAKITRHGGASNKTVPSPEAGAAPKHVAPLLEATPGEALPPVPDEAYAPDSVPLEGGEESSPGSSSSASSAKPPTSSEPSKPARRKPVRMTGSRSAKARTESSSARLTVGEKTDPTSGPDSD